MVTDTNIIAEMSSVQLRMWGDARAAIDAMVIPDWESNTGFVWRLFAATPAVIRVQSASYQASTWCRREAELTQYLLERSDFFRGRVVADVSIPQLPALDRAVTQLSSAAQPGQVPPANAGPDFPRPLWSWTFPATHHWLSSCSLRSVRFGC